MNPGLIKYCVNVPKLLDKEVMKIAVKNRFSRTIQVNVWIEEGVERELKKGKVK